MAELGDAVVVVMARNNIFPWQNSPRFRAKFRQGPQGTGDTFMVDVPGVGTISINGNGADFTGIYPAAPSGEEAPDAG